jgi:hypothetical protein
MNLIEPADAAILFSLSFFVLFCSEWAYFLFFQLSFMPNWFARLLVPLPIELSKNIPPIPGIPPTMPAAAVFAIGILGRNFSTIIAAPMPSKAAPKIPLGLKKPDIIEPPLDFLPLLWYFLVIESLLVVLCFGECAFIERFAFFAPLFTKRHIPLGKTICAGMILFFFN